MRVTFRANFQGPKGALNTVGFKCSNLAMTVEIYRKADSWFGRAVINAIRTATLYQLGSAPTHGAMKDTVSENFERQLSPWVMFDPEGKELDPSRVKEDPKGNFSLKELSHVGARPAPGQEPYTSPLGPNYFKTDCGVDVHVRLIRSVRGTKPPDCPICKTTWEKTPEEHRLKS